MIITNKEYLKTKPPNGVTQNTIKNHKFQEFLSKTTILLKMCNKYPTTSFLLVFLGN